MLAPLSNTGCQAIPTCSNPFPKAQTAPTTNPTATTTSNITTNPNAKFLISVFNLDVNVLVFSFILSVFSPALFPL